MLAYYLPCSSYRERIANKLRNQDYLLLPPFIHSVVLQPKGDKKIKGSQGRRKSDEIGKQVYSKCSMQCLPFRVPLSVLLELNNCVEISHVCATKRYYRPLNVST